MKSYKTQLVLGIITFLIPFLGVPEVYKNWATVIIAVILIIYSLRVRYFIRTENGLNEKEIFVESKGEREDDLMIRSEELPAESAASNEVPEPEDSSEEIQEEEDKQVES